MSGRSPVPMLDAPGAAVPCRQGPGRRPYRVAYLVSHPIQYQAPMLRYLAARPELDVTALFLSDFSVREYRDPGFGVPVQWDVPLLDGYRYQFLPGLGRRGRVNFWRPLAGGLWRTLKRGRFDALWIHGYAQLSVLRAVAVANAQGVKVLLRGDSHLTDARRGPVKSWLKRRAMPRFFQLIDGFLAIGTLNRQYYRHYGVRDDRIFTMPYAVDNELFRRQIAEAARHREPLRAELHLEAARPVILYASKLMPRKRPMDLLDAYERLSPDGREPRPYLVFVGDGEERPRLEHRARQREWSSVRFVGFRNQTELPRYYDLADVFVLPSSHEPWGLVVNEVMNAGKPIVVSDGVGAAPDLVQDGENGFVVPVGQLGILAERLARLTSDPDLARRMGEQSLRRISSWDFAAGAAGLTECLETTLCRR